MSVVVAIKENGKVYMGADTQTTRACKKIRSIVPNNYKMWKVANFDHCLIGAVGSVRTENIIRTADDIIPEDYDGEVDFKFVVRHVVPYIFSELKEHEILTKDKDDDTPLMDGSLLFACKDKLFQITGTGTVLEVEDCITMGSGDDEAMGALIATEGQNPIMRIKKALDAAARYGTYVDYPMTLADTDTCDIQIIEEKDW